MTYAARILSARPQTISELRQKLMRRAARAADVQQVLERLKQLGYLNDQRFAESFASWRRENQGLGKSRVVRDLLARRVAPDLAKKARRSRLFGRRRNRHDRAVSGSQISRQKSRRAVERREIPGFRLPETAHTAGNFGAGNSISVLKRLRGREAERLEDLEESPTTRPNALLEEVS